MREFEGRFGSADADTLAVLAQAAHLCWFHASYAENLLAVCRAIAAMKSTPFSHCCQISPARWIQMNAYVIGVQTWLGFDLPLPSEIDKGLIERIGAWLGERSSTKDALAALFLCQLVDHLVFRASFATMGGEAGPTSALGVLSASGAYADYTPWYARPDDGRYSTGNDYDVSSDRAEADGFLEDCLGRVRQMMRSAPDDAEELLSRILGPSQPPCMHRFSRYQDIKLASIGALKWRGSLPPSDSSRERWEAFWGEAEEGLKGWVNGASPRGGLAVRVHRALDEPTEERKAIISGFLLEKPGSTALYYWLKEKSRSERASVASLFLRGDGRE